MGINCMIEANQKNLPQKQVQTFKTMCIFWELELIIPYVSFTYLLFKQYLLNLL